MGLDVVHRRWLLAGPGLVAGGFLLSLVLLPYLNHRLALSYVVFCVGAGVFVSFISISVALFGRLPPQRKWTQGDIVYLAVGALPLMLLAVAAFVAVAGVSG